jgi:serine phosphatase RsbU (regulator of sigma subunit)
VISSFGAGHGVRREYARVGWEKTPLGPVQAWNPTLMAAVNLSLNTRFPVTLLWGPEFVMLYNDAYVQLIGDKHPGALGAPAQQVFPEIWDKVAPMLNSVLAGGGATWVEDLRLDLNRHGFLEECYFTFSYSAVTGLGGGIEGVIDITTESTPQILSRRRMALLSDLNTELAALTDLERVRERALEVLRSDPDDLPEVEITLAGDLPRELAEGDLHLDRGAAYVKLAPAGDPAEHAMLFAELSPLLVVDQPYLGFLRLIGSSISQAINRVGAQESERRMAKLERDMSEALQRSLLTAPVAPEGIEIAVRYQPAEKQAFVGGDWYDSLVFDDGRLTVAIGDVSGHDRQAAVAMAQIRNLLRGIAYTLRRSPSLILSELDRCMNGLGPSTVASVLLAQLEPTPGREGHTLHWCNAGHPPPILLAPDGSARLLHSPPELLLGVIPGAARTDHRVELEPHSSVVLYTDGLVERHKPGTSRGPESLIEVLAGQQHLSAEQLCDHLLAHFDDTGDDDVALTVVRTTR